MALTYDQIERFLQDSEEEIRRLDAIYENCVQTLKDQGILLQDAENSPQLEELKAQAIAKAQDEGRRRVMDLESQLGFTTTRSTAATCRRGLRVW